MLCKGGEYVTKVKLWLFGAINSVNSTGIKHLNSL